MKKEFNNKGFKVESSLVWIPTILVDIKEQERLKAKEMFQELEAGEDIHGVFANIKE